MLDTKKILADNITRLLDTKQGIARFELSKQMDVADGTLGRIKYGNGNPNVETLDAIAHFFRLETWHLLTENLDPKRPPTILSDSEAPDGLTDDERELIRVVRMLREPERTYLFKQARSYMEAMEVASTGPDKSEEQQKTGTDAEPAIGKGPLWGTW